MQAIRTATITAEVLGIGRDLGSLQGGKVADVVAVAGSPLDNIRLLEDVRFVMQAGRSSGPAGRRPSCAPARRTVP